jgi:hypothetical protein
MSGMYLANRASMHIPEVRPLKGPFVRSFFLI